VTVQFSALEATAERSPHHVCSHIEAHCIHPELRHLFTDATPA
jgi:hypothetical protein